MLEIKKQTGLINQEKYSFNRFEISPLEANQGITLGNALRRSILSNTPGLGLYSVLINDTRNEFDTILGVRENVLEIILNLKDLSFCFPLILKNDRNEMSAFLYTTGPKVITSNYLKFPKNNTRIINPTKYICTISENCSLYMELKLKVGKGYSLNEVANNVKKHIPQNIININSEFCPVKNINYVVNLCYNNNGLLKEALIINIITNGSITPLRCLLESLKNLHTTLQSIASNINLEQ